MKSAGDEKRLSLVLKVLARGGKPEDLTKRNFTLTQIGLLLEKCLRRGYIRHDGISLRVTEMGYAAIQRAQPLPNSVASWPLAPDPTHKLDATERPGLYVPPRRTVAAWKGKSELVPAVSAADQRVADPE